MPAAPRRLALATALVALATAPGCPLLEELSRQAGGLGEALAPLVDATEPELRHAPSLRQLAAHYCPAVLDDPLVRLTCAAALGPPPPASELVFTFGLALHMENPNDIPIPALETLIALSLFEGEEAEALGAVCVSFCGADDPTCDPAPGPGACESDQPEIRTWGDVVGRLPGLIADLASGAALDELRKSTLAAGGDLTVDLAFDLGVDQALSVFRKTAVRYVQDLVAGRDAALDVPVSGEGTVFFDLPSLGRFGVGYGPVDGVWRIR